MELRPISLKEAGEFVLEHHRHNRPTIGHKFSLEARDGGKTIGVAIIGRPVSRHLDDGKTLEILRTCTDGTRNANSFLYGAACRAAFALGYWRVITYTLTTEPGIGPRAAGFRIVHKTKAEAWTRASRERKPGTTDGVEKYRWERQLEIEP